MPRINSSEKRDTKNSEMVNARAAEGLGYWAKVRTEPATTCDILIADVDLHLHPCRQEQVSRSLNGLKIPATDSLL
ncbi:MAG TPA: hypothetical protein VL361_28700 [Candidatus Limnocylindrales bacterium]|nr:hypothetical protein [Candidatus Limnocylindrales bacterium]